MVSFVITGGRGLGLEFATQFSANPENHVFSLVRDSKSVTQLNALASERKNLHILQADVTDLPALRKAAKDVSEITGGTLEILINNAAYQTTDLDNFKSLSELQGEEEGSLTKDLDAGFKTNVLGPIYVTNTFLPLLRAGKTKKVISLSTGMADLEFVKQSEIGLSAPYAITKAALNMVNVKYAVDLKEEGFTFLAISPGYVATSDGSWLTDQHMVGLGKMIKGFERVKPGYKGEALTPTESVEMLWKLIDKATVKDTGSFISHLGDQNWL